MTKETKVFLKEDEADDEFKKGDEIMFKKMKGIVVNTTHYIIIAEFIIYTWKERLKGWIWGSK